MVDILICVQGLMFQVSLTQEMDVTGVLKLRVIFGDDNAERLTLPSRPETVDALIFQIKQKWLFVKSHFNEKHMTSASSLKTQSSTMPYSI